MEKTPKCKSKSKYFKNNNSEENTDNKLNSSTSKLLEIESPGYLSCTQEGFENIDVVWDWNSPQSKRIPKKSQKRLALPSSPKKTIKRHLSNNSIQGFEKLQEELRLLKEEIAIPEHEESLVLSPVEEAEYKYVNNSDCIDNIELEDFINENEDIFGDSFDEQLLECTTQIEDQLNKVDKKQPSLCIDNLSKNRSTNQVENLKNIPAQNKEIKQQQSNISSLSIGKDTNSVGNLVPPLKKEEQQSGIFHVKGEITDFDESLQLFSSRNNLKPDNLLTVGKVEFHRTQSFEISNFEHLGGIPLSKKEEIERKRQEALAKLEFKKKHGSFVISPLQCSSEEIERKRQEALAKREARRQQEIIERNRQNALKRLEITRKKNAQAVKSTLTSRLN